MTNIIIRVVAAVVAIATALWCLANWGTLQERARGNGDPGVHLQVVYAQQPATRALVLFPEPLGPMGGMRPHECPHEDGDPSGRPCVWTDYPTGRGYFIDSTEYLD
jgi:hypothetical protein